MKKYSWLMTFRANAFLAEAFLIKRSEQSWSEVYKKCIFDQKFWAKIPWSEVYKNCASDQNICPMAIVLSQTLTHTLIYTVNHTLANTLTNTLIHTLILLQHLRYMLLTPPCNTHCFTFVTLLL